MSPILIIIIIIIVIIIILIIIIIIICSAKLNYIYTDAVTINIYNIISIYIPHCHCMRSIKRLLLCIHHGMSSLVVNSLISCMLLILI